MSHRAGGLAVAQVRLGELGLPLLGEERKNRDPLGDAVLSKHRLRLHRSRGDVAAAAVGTDVVVAVTVGPAHGHGLRAASELGLRRRAAAAVAERGGGVMHHDQALDAPGLHLGRLRGLHLGLLAEVPEEPALVAGCVPLSATATRGGSSLGLVGALGRDWHVDLHRLVDTADVTHTPVIVLAVEGLQEDVARRPRPALGQTAVAPVPAREHDGSEKRRPKPPVHAVTTSIVAMTPVRASERLVDGQLQVQAKATVLLLLVVGSRVRDELVGARGGGVGDTTCGGGARRGVLLELLSVLPVHANLVRTRHDHHHLRRTGHDKLRGEGAVENVAERHVRPACIHRVVHRHGQLVVQVGPEHLQDHGLGRYRGLVGRIIVREAHNDLPQVGADVHVHAVNGEVGAQQARRVARAAEKVEELGGGNETLERGVEAGRRRRRRRARLRREDSGIGRTGGPLNKSVHLLGDDAAGDVSGEIGSENAAMGHLEDRVRNTGIILIILFTSVIFFFNFFFIS